MTIYYFYQKLITLVFYDVVNNLQKVKSNFEVFNIPFKLDISKNIKMKKKL